MKRIQLLVLWMLLTMQVASAVQNYGLYVKAHEVEPAERTSVLIANGDYFVDALNSKINFDIYLRRGTSRFGLISRMLSDNGLKIDLIQTASQGLVLNVDTASLTFKVPMGEWLTIEYRFLLDRLEITVQGVKKHVTIGNVSNSKLALFFGKVKSPAATAIIDEIAAFNLKDVSVKSNERSVYLWKFERHNYNVCYDEITKCPTAVSNPEWLIDDYVNWKKVHSYKTNKKQQFVFDEQKNAIYIIDDQSGFHLLDLATLQVTNDHYEGYPYSIESSQIVLDTLRHSLISYSIPYQKISSLDLLTKEWSLKKLPFIDEQFHAAEAYDVKNGVLYTFGGYGNFKYNNRLSVFDVQNNSCQTITLSSIKPRYHAAMAQVGNKLYVFGGRGSLDGKQLVNPTPFYNLYEISTTDFSVKQCWSMPDRYDFYCAPTMIYEERDSSFIALSGFRTGQLIRISKNQPRVTLLGEALKKDFNVGYSYLALYYSRQQQKLYAVVEQRYKQGDSDVSILSINYPPLEPMANIQVAPKHTSEWRISLISGLLLLFVTLSLFFWNRRKRRLVTIPNEGASDIPDETVLVAPSENSMLSEKSFSLNKETISDPPIKKEKSSIRLLREFTVINKNGENITKEFSPTLKKLFLLLLMETKLSPNGILAKKVDLTIWFDKMDTSASNNRNVSLRKLRLLLEMLDGENLIENHNGYLRLSLSDAVFCDYWQIMDGLSSESVFQVDVLADSFSHLLRLLGHGVLLPNVQEDWLDDYKSKFSSFVVDYLSQSLLASSSAKDSVRLAIADALLIHDPLSDEALKTKCSILLKQGKASLAKEVYNIYCKRYKTLLGEEYAIPFGQLSDKSIHS